MPKGIGYLGGMAGKAGKGLSGRAAKLKAAEDAAMGVRQTSDVDIKSRSNDSTRSQRSAADIAKDER